MFYLSIQITSFGETRKLPKLQLNNLPPNGFIQEPIGFKFKVKLSHLQERVVHVESS